MDKTMTTNIAGEFAKHLLGKNFIAASPEASTTTSKGLSSEITLRKLWELTDLSANDFADEVARFYGFSMTTPIRELSAEHIQKILYGSGQERITLRYESKSGRSREYRAHYEGVIPNLERRLDNIVVIVASPVPHRCAKR